MAWTRSSAASCAGVVLSLVIGGVSCSSVAPATGPGPAICDPLAPPPITLGAVVGVGQDADGTLYVDAANGVFVSSAGKLVRQQVLGSGQVGTDYFTFSFRAPGDDGSAARDLIVHTAGTSATMMGLGPEGSGKLQSDVGVTPLALVATSAIAGMPVINTPNVISYIADTADGNVLLATVPLNVPSGPSEGGVYDGGLSIFYGPATAVVQRTITAFEESKSGNGTLTFLVDHKPYDLDFGQVPGPDAGPFGMFALLALGPQGGPSMAITLRTPTPATIPADLIVTCVP